ncbi:MAG: TRAP transporter TatT component family protein [Gammaproteobacteria bacterium]|nr:TRAP transporter TatT component family protein [Gammaproteobacteria bacterium]
MKLKLILLLIIISSSQFLTGCSLSISNFSENITKAVKSNNDIETVKQALPAYLILLDGLIEDDPKDEDLLLASSNLMNAYASLISADIEMLVNENDKNLYYKKKLIRQQKNLTYKSLQRVSKAICIYDENLCDLTSLKYDDFYEKIKSIDEEDMNILYMLGTSWAAWLQANTDDWNAMAQLPQINLIMETVISYDESWDNGGAHMYLGVLNSFIPATLGGKPELGKSYFETAIKLTNDKNQMVKVLYAEYYARLTFDEELHEKLISEVLSFQNSPPEYILINTIALQKANALLATSKEYF